MANTDALLMPKIVVACSGGGMRGAFQAGAIQTLIQRGVVVDAWTGVSTGAIQAGFMAQVLPEAQPLQATRLAELWLSLHAAPVSGGLIEAIGRALFGKPSLHRADAFVDLLRQHVTSGPNLPVEVGATSLASGKYLGIRPATPATLREAILASASVPGYFPPVGPEGLVDGGIHHVAPLRPAFKLANALWPPTIPVVIVLLHCLPLDPWGLPPECGPAEGMQHPPLWKLGPRGLDILSTSNERKDLASARQFNEALRLYQALAQARPGTMIPPWLAGKRYARIVQVAPTTGPTYPAMGFDPEGVAAYLRHGRDRTHTVLDNLGPWPPT